VPIFDFGTQLTSNHIFNSDDLGYKETQINVLTLLFYGTLNISDCKTP